MQAICKHKDKEKMPTHLPSVNWVNGQWVTWELWKPQSFSGILIKVSTINNERQTYIFIKYLFQLHIQNFTASTQFLTHIRKDREIYVDKCVEKHRWKITVFHYIFNTNIYLYTIVYIIIVYIIIYIQSYLGDVI